MTAIVRAAELILEEEGEDHLTTNRLAERAGVSIGSFYQYFPNREAVLAELGRTIERRTLELFEQKLAESRGDPVELVDHTLDILLSNSLGSHRARAHVVLQVPRSWTQQVSRAVDERVVAMVEQTLVTHQDRFPLIDQPRISALMLVTAVESIVEACIERHRDWIESGQLSAQLKLLVLRYLGIVRTLG